MSALSFRTNQTGSNPEDWFVYDFMYCGSLQTFDRAADLLKAWQDKALKPCPFNSSSLDPQQNGGPGDWDIPGLAPNGNQGLGLPCPRRDKHALGVAFSSGPTVVENGRLVSWLGWTFFATVRPATGLAVMDVRFKGQRIAHEIALSEAVAYYSGSGRDQVMYLDSAWSMTQLSAPLIPGVDCPADAAYLNGTQMTFLENPSSSRAGSPLSPQRSIEQINACTDDSQRSDQGCAVQGSVRV